MKITALIKKFMPMAIGMAMCSAYAEDGVLYVDAANYGKPGLNGKTEATAYGTIQDAIDAAESGWTVRVKPGTYDKGGKATTEWTEVADCVARVLVTKPLTIVSMGSAADTFIVGEADSDPTAQSKYNGCGPNAVRCVRFEKAAGEPGSPSVLKGFTIRDGHCADQRSSGTGWGTDILAGQPGGVAGADASHNHFYVSDCVISNCFGVRAGAVRYGRYVRCSFGTCFGAAGDNLGRDLYCISCLFVGAKGSMNSGYVVNCTFVDAPESYPFYTSNARTDIYNTIVAHVKPMEDVTEASYGVSRNSALPVAGVNADEKDCVYRTEYPFFAPLRGDYRVRAESPAATVGNAEVLTGRIESWFATAPNAVEIRKALDGMEYPEKGALPAGCYAVAKPTVGGAVRFDGGVITCDGWVSRGGERSTAQYAFSDKARDVVRVMPPKGKWYFGYKRGDAFGGFQYPEMDESFYQHFPPAGIVVTNAIIEVAKHLWVDADNGVDAADSGTESKPCKTLAYVIGKVSNSEHTLVHAAEGDYNDGVMVSSDSSSGDFGRTRVNLEKKFIRLKGAGRGRSFISGEPDSGTSPSDLDRRGPAAMRCVVLDGVEGYRSCVQGFTLRNGYADKGTDNLPKNCGGLVYAAAQHGNNQIVDCELVGGQAHRSAQVHYAICTRCILHGWRLPTAGHAVRFGALRSCLVYDEGFDNNANIANADVYQSTIAHTNATGQTHIGDTTTFDGSVLFMPNRKDTVRQDENKISGTFYELPASYAFYCLSPSTEKIPTSLARKVEIGFADSDNADFRIRTTSAVFSQQFDVSAKYWKMPATDVYGVPFNFTSGKAVPGAVATPAQVVIVNPPPYGSFTSGLSGTNLVEKGDVVEVAYNETASRHAETLLVGGVPVGGLSYVYAYDGRAFAEDGLVLAPAAFTVQYSTNWYVNVSAESDGNGFTPETAWKSLMQIKDSGYVLPGDCVHVAAGDYIEAGYVDATLGDSCVWIPSGVAVVADEGPAETRILGKMGTGKQGRGAGAMRCVYVESGATISGFTLANGYSTGETGADNDPREGGGGVLVSTKASDDASCGMVYGCVISNCVASRGGAAYNGRLVNCKVLDCYGVSCTSAGRYSLLVGCYVDGCRQAQWCRGGLGVYRCTFGPNNLDGTNPFEGCASVDNCVIMRSATVDATRAKLFHNCLVLDGTAWTVEMKALAPDCKWFTDYASMGIDAAGHPLSKTAEPVDNGTTLQTATYDGWLGGLDAAGLQRIYNGAIDTGCYEYDWRGVYRADLGNCAKVLDADPKVIETDDGKVLIKDGLITVRFTDESFKAKYKIPFRVTGTGTLTLTAGDEIVGTYVAADGAQTLTYKNRISGNDLAFSYVPGENDAGGALLDAMAGGVAGLLLMVW